MATWKKVIVSGSTANLANVQVDGLTSGQVVIGGGTAGNLTTTAINGTGNIVATTGATVNMSGSFSGSFVGNGAGLTGVTATAIFPTSQVNNITSTDKFFISQSGNQYITYGDLLTDLAGTNLAVEGTDSLTLASQISVTGVTASFLGNLTGTASYATQATNAFTASYVLNAISASYALNSTTATNANNVAVTDTTSGTGPYYVMFADGTTGNRAVRVDSNALTFNATTNTLTATSSYANQATSAFTASYVQNATSASYVLNAVSASYALNATTAATASYVLNAVTASYVLNAVSASLAAAVSSIANNVTNNTDNRVLTATGGGTINGEGNLTFDGTTLTVTGNEVITGNLTVQGTASFQNTTNLEVADRFVLFASGSNTAGDGGIVIQQATQNVGELFAYENSVNRWGFTSSFNASSPSYTAAAFVTTTEVGTTAPPTAPIYGGASNGLGNIYVRSTTEEIFIYS
jgi:trimeric autotransporter adhesin